MSSIRLIFALHNHQPVGNFDDVFAASFRDAYAPFLELARQYPDLSFVLHTSGPLLEWLAANQPGYVDALREWQTSGPLEILGGAFHEPILPNIPERDRVGQIRDYSEYLERLFGRAPRGMWLPERVWEQSLVKAIVDAGIEYTVLDDFHFQQSGVEADDLLGYHLTEDQGWLLRVFPNSERLRYLIPWQEPHEAYVYLRSIAERAPGAVVVCADDGEKFGGWPQTYDHVYKNNWMRRFFDMLRANRSWIETTTFARAVDETLPRGKVFLGDASYREMTEWSLAPDRYAAYRNALDALDHTPNSGAVRPFVRSGGFWRNFRARYAESDEMYCRMLGLSQRLARLEDAGASQPQHLATARDHLYRGQCNCPYWHGTFGGLYLPHLRNAIYENLIAAHAALDKAEGRLTDHVEAAVGDFNLDARQEVCLQNERLVAWIRPALGGHLYELDDKESRVNLLATIDRRPEPYHAAILASIKENAPPTAGEPLRFKQAGLDSRLAYDRHPRKAFVDHIYPLETTLRDLIANRDIERGDFATGTYLGQIETAPNAATVRLARPGIADGHRIRVEKTYTVEAANACLRVGYSLSELPAGQSICWAVEINVAAMAAAAADRLYVDEHGRRLGTLDAALELEHCSAIVLSDGWRNLSVHLSWDQPTGVWTHPIETVSQSEGGYEAVYQSSAVIPHWIVTGDAEGRWGVEIRMRLDRAVDARVPERRRAAAASASL